MKTKIGKAKVFNLTLFTFLFIFALLIPIFALTMLMTKTLLSVMSGLNDYYNLEFTLPRLHSNYNEYGKIFAPVLF